MIKIILLCALLILVSADGILKTKSGLILLDSYSSIPILNFTNIPTLNDALDTSTESSFFSTVVESGGLKLALNAYENFYAPFSYVYPTFVLYNISGNVLQETSRLFCPIDVGVSNALFSPTSSRKYATVSTYQSIFGANPFLPHVNLVKLHTYSTLGVINQTPSVVFDESTLSPSYYNTTISYNGLACSSSDGKYLVATYALGVGIPGYIVGQKYHMLEVSSSLTTLTPKASINSAPTGMPDLYSFPQGCVMWPYKTSTTKYNIIMAENSWNFSNVLGYTAQVSYYTYDSSTDSLVHKDSDWVSQYIQGFDVDVKNNRVYTITNEVSSVPICTQQKWRQPYDNPSVDVDSELRAWKLDETAGLLVYKGGADLNSDGIQVRSSHDGKRLAVTTAPLIFDDVFLTNYTALGPVANRYGPSTVSMYRAYGIFDIFLNLESVSSASPLSFGLAFDSSDEHLVVTGQSKYFNLDGQITGQKDTQLYKFVDNDE